MFTFKMVATKLWVILSKSEKIKETLGWMKVVFGILSAIDVSLIAWIANNYDKIDINVTKIYVASFIAVVIAFSIIFVNKKAIKKLDKLEQLWSKLLLFLLHL